MSVRRRRPTPAGCKSMSLTRMSSCIRLSSRSERWFTALGRAGPVDFGRPFVDVVGPGSDAALVVPEAGFDVVGEQGALRAARSSGSGVAGSPVMCAVILRSLRAWVDPQAVAGGVDRAGNLGLRGRKVPQPAVHRHARPHHPVTVFKARVVIDEDGHTVADQRPSANLPVLPAGRRKLRTNAQRSGTAHKNSRPPAPQATQRDAGDTVLGRSR